jgi:predicted RND superfamily exporter protein
MEETSTATPHPVPARPVRLALRHPLATLAVWGVALAAALPGIARLELRTDGRALVPPRAPAVLRDREIRSTFGRRDPLLVLIEPSHPDGVYNPETLRRIAGLTAALAALPGVGPEHVRSLATQRGSRYDPGRKDFLPLLDPFPETPARLAEVRQEVAWLDLPDGLLVARDGSAAVVVVGVPPREASGGDRYDFWRRVDARARRWGEVEAELRGLPEVGGVIGPYRLLTTAAGIAGGDVRFRQIRRRPEWNAVLYAQVDRVLGEQARREIVNGDFSRGVVEVFLRQANFRDTSRLMARARALERERLAPVGGAVSFGGDVAVSQEMIPAIVNGQVRSRPGSPPPATAPRPRPPSPGSPASTRSPSSRPASAAAATRPCRPGTATSRRRRARS